MITVALLNSSAGAGKTLLVSHLAWMFAEHGVPVLAVDVDPRASLTFRLLSDDRIRSLWDAGATTFALQATLSHHDSPSAPHLEPIAENLHLLVGDPRLIRCEDAVAESWFGCQNGDPGALRAQCALAGLVREAAERVGAVLVLLDLGPGLGALNRAALLGADHVVLPVRPDIRSLWGLETVGAALRDWRNGWHDRLRLNAENAAVAPTGAMRPMGYVVTSLGARDGRLARRGEDWNAAIPPAFHEAMRASGRAEALPDPDPDCLARLQHYWSLMPLAIEARKPMFLLRPADGARGAHLDAVRACYDDFLGLARRIGDKLGVPVP